MFLPVGVGVKEPVGEGLPGSTTLPPAPLQKAVATEVLLPPPAPEP